MRILKNEATRRARARLPITIAELREIIRAISASCISCLPNKFHQNDNFASDTFIRRERPNIDDLSILRSADRTCRFAFPRKYLRGDKWRAILFYSFFVAFFSTLRIARNRGISFREKRAIVFPRPSRYSCSRNHSRAEARVSESKSYASLVGGREGILIVARIQLPNVVEARWKRERSGSLLLSVGEE